MTRLALTGAGALAVLAVAIATAAAGASAKDDLQAAKAASARYHSVKQARASGYSGQGEPCVSSPAGAMGIHWPNGPLIGDNALDPLRPEILLYIPSKHGKLKLIGLEYFKVDADQNLATDDDRPSLFGQPFDGPMPGHNPTMPIHYDLHVWLWAANPSGIFAQFNPNLACP